MIFLWRLRRTRKQDVSQKGETKPAVRPKKKISSLTAPRTRTSLPWHRHADHFVGGFEHDGALVAAASSLPLHLLRLAVVVVVVVPPTATAAAAAVVVAPAVLLRRRGRRRRRARRAPLLRGLVPRRRELLVVVAEAVVGSVVAVV
jgi:hypothetical protein